jgi:hypothetical protein
VPRPRARRLRARPAHPPSWFEEAAEGERTADGTTFRLRDLRRPGPGLLAATVECQVGGRVWTQSFTTERLDDQALAAALAEPACPSTPT